MSKTYIQDKTFEKENFVVKPLPQGEYENCIFSHCNFLNGDLSNSVFVDCEFKGCNLSNVKLVNTAFRNIQFNACKLLGLHFETCNEFLFQVGFENCSLNLSSFYKQKIKKTIFRNCELKEVDFTGTDLSAALFDNCDLMNAIFEETTLEKADLRSAFNYAIDPELNRIKKAKFSQQGIAGLLLRYDIDIE